MRTLCFADIRTNCGRGLLVAAILVLTALPVVAQRITADTLRQGHFPEVVRGRLDRFPDKSIHRLPVAKQATSMTEPDSARPPIFSFFQQSSRSGSVNYGFMVGTSPFSLEDVHGASVRTFVVPVVFVVHQVATDFALDSNNNVILTGITDKDATYDPTKPAPACLGRTNNVPFQLAIESPIFQNHHWVWGGTDLGNTQYGDAFQRANFWQTTGGEGDYHLLLNPVDVLPPAVLDFPKGSGIGLPQSSTFFGYSACAPTVMVDFSYFDDLLNYVVLPQLAASGVNASAFTMFIAGNALWGQVIGELPIYFPEAAGYHSFSDLDSSLNYGVTQFGDENVFTWPDAVPLSHEVGEWMNDPNASNYVTLYNVNVLSTTGPAICQGNYEVGDILAGVFMPPVTGKNGYTYTLQELAFFSYFYGGPSRGVNGWYSNNNTLKTDAGPACSLL